jgi:hypothetical protein
MIVEESIHRQVARERAARIAEDYRRAQGGAGRADRPRRRGLAAVAAAVRRWNDEGVPAYRQ